MDSESEGADWKQEERVLAVVAYRIEKVSECLPLRYQKSRGCKSKNFWLGLVGVFQIWAAKH
jgi:hypothetical protein